MLKDILQSEIMERKILDSRLKTIETSIKEGQFGRTDDTDASMGEKLLEMERLIEEVKQDAKTSTDRRKQIERLKQALQRAWKDHKTQMLNMIREINEHIDRRDDSKILHELTATVEGNLASVKADIQTVTSRTNNAIKELEEDLATKVEQCRNDVQAFQLAVWKNITALRQMNDYKGCFDGSFNNYAGRISHTLFGRVCQRWDQQTPHEHGVKAGDLPERHFSKAENYCRDPSDSGFLWCYTTDKNVRWEPCEVEPCCYVDSHRYAGFAHVTENGRPCQSWDQQYPHQHKVKKADLPEGSFLYSQNFCRDPSKSGFLWCYTSDPEVRWEKCNVPRC